VILTDGGREVMVVHKKSKDGGIKDSQLHIFYLSLSFFVSVISMKE